MTSSKHITLTIIFIGAFLTSHWTASPAKADDAPRFLFIDTVPRDEKMPFVDGGILARELMRQAVWIAADDMGIRVRDAALRESSPATNEKGVRFRIQVILHLNDGLRVRFLKGDPKTETEMWKFESPLKPTPGKRLDYVALMHDAEAFSRNQFPNALKTIGFTGDPKNATTPPEIANELEALIDTMSLFSQFDVLRRLHAEKLKNGEHQVLLEGLITGYANLSKLTSHFWNSMPKVFAARSLLYAERLVSLYPNSARAHWHRAYARALAGFHRLALDEIAGLPANTQESQVQGPKIDSKNRRTDAPKWSAILKPYCEYRTGDLTQAASNNPSIKQLALFLAFMTLDDGSAADAALVIADKLLEEQPDSFRVIDGMCEFGGISNLHKVTMLAPQVLGITLPQQLESMSGLHSDVVNALKSKLVSASQRKLDAVLDASDDADTNVGLDALEIPDLCASVPTIVKALVGAGDPVHDDNQLSWTVLGRMIEECLFVQIYRRVDFMKNQWGVEFSDFLRESLPLIKKHPYASLIASMALEPNRDSTELAEILANLRDDDSNWNLYLATRKITKDVSDSRKKEPLNRVWRMAMAHSDLIVVDRKFVTQTSDKSRKVAAAKQIIDVSPYCPFGFLYLIRHDWEYSKGQADNWGRNLTYLPSVMGELATAFANEKNYKASDECLHKYLKVSKDFWAYELLAKNALAQGNRENWRAILEGTLKNEDRGLEHMTVRMAIANYLMSQGKWSEALPYAEAAGETWASSAMDCACICNEAMRNWKDAEKWIRRSAERYDSRQFSWFYWCVRTGHGDIESARKGALKLAEATTANDVSSPFDLEGAAITFELLGKHKAAIRALDESYRSSRSVFTGWLRITLSTDSADSRLQTEILDYIQRIPHDPKDRNLNALVDLAKLFVSHSDVREIELSAIQKVAEAAVDAAEANIYFFAGRLLEIKEEKSKAKECLVRSAQCRKGYPRACQVMAIDLLRKRGIKVESVIPGPENDSDDD